MRTRRRNRIGTNQYKVKQHGTWKRYLAVYFIGLILVIAFAQHFKNEGARVAYADAYILSPVPDNFNIEIEAEKLEVEKDPERAEIEAYIKEVFGEHADKAFKVLSCENASLNPYAVNTAGNEPEGSRDTGVFQINEYWQQVQYKFLLNYKVNVEIAYQIFTENGNSFERWTCGRKFNI